MRSFVSPLAVLVSVLAVVSGCGGSDAATAPPLGSGAGGSAGSGGGAGAAGQAAGQGGGAGAAGACTVPAATKPTWCSLPGAAPDHLVVPAGFCARAFTPPGFVVSPRTMRFSPSGDLFVAAPAVGSPGGAQGGLGAVVVLPDDDKDGVADAVKVYAGAAKGASGKSCLELDADPNNLECVHGIAFTSDALYVTKWNEVRRYAYAPGDRQAPASGSTLAATLGMPTTDVFRYTHTLDVGQGGRLFVSRGRFEAACMGVTTDMTKGAILSFDPKAPAGEAKVVADGFRNPMYLRCHASGTCLANELSGDGWIGIGQESVFLVTEGQHLGYPCCYKKDAPAPGATPGMCADVPEVPAAFPISHTPFGLAWAPAAWPCGMGGGLFVAKHGQVGTWNNADVVWFQTDETGVPVGTARPFTSGFGQGLDKMNARPADVAFAPDGRMFIAQDQDNDKGGRIYWVAPENLEIP